MRKRSLLDTVLHYLVIAALIAGMVLVGYVMLTGV